MHAGGEAGLFDFGKHADIEFAANFGLAAHGLKLGRRGNQMLTLAGALGQALAHHLLAVGGGLERALESLAKLGVLRLLLAVEVVELLQNLNDAREVRTVFGRKLGSLLLKIAAPLMDLAECGDRQAAGLALKARIGGQHEFRIALHGGAILGFAQDAVRAGNHHLTAELIHFEQSRGMLARAGRPVGRGLRRDQKTVLVLEIREALLVPVGFRLHVAELAVEPAGGLRGSQDARLCLLILIGADQRIEHVGGKVGVARLEAQFDQNRARYGPDMERVLKALKQPGLGGGIRRVRPEPGRSAGVAPVKPGTW